MFVNLPKLPEMSLVNSNIYYINNKKMSKYYFFNSVIYPLIGENSNHFETFFTNDTDSLLPGSQGPRSMVQKTSGELILGATAVAVVLILIFMRMKKSKTDNYHHINKNNSHDKLDNLSLNFKTGHDFFEYYCNYMDSNIEEGKALAAIVIDAKKDFGTSAAVKTDKNGIQTAVLRVASSDGGFVVTSQTLSANGAPLYPGDIVAWLPKIYKSELGNAMGEKRSGWIGLIIAKVAPEIDLSSKEMKVISHY